MMGCLKIFIALIFIVAIGKFANEQNVYGLLMSAYAVGSTVFCWYIRAELIEYKREFRNARQIIQNEMYPEDREFD
jgi:hypothetical protein